jgi:hypothetical protein
MRLTRELETRERTAADREVREVRSMHVHPLNPWPQDIKGRDPRPRNLRIEADAWVRSMEEGNYPLLPSPIDPGLKAEVVRQIRARLADGSEWLRKFLFEHASESIHSMPELYEELNAITRYHNANDYIRQLDEWAISVWQRFPLQPSQLLP